MQLNLRSPLFVSIVILSASMPASHAVSEAAPDALASVESFASIGDTAARSAAIFTELGKVLTHPRCLNCHPAGDRPRQGDMARLHQANVDTAGVPGNPIWHLAPRDMGWEGKTLREICIQIKDPARNGNRSVDALIEHIGEDHLVGWAWAPGYGRQPAPGTQKQAGALVEAWVKTGAECPN
jgi:hypothetical protein